MLCTFFIHGEQPTARSIGPISVDDRAQVQRLVQAEYARSAAISAIDVWEAGGPLYRLFRRAGANDQPIPLRISP
jgi:hypothetical protein